MVCSTLLGILAVPGKHAFCNAETFWVEIQNLMLLWPIATTVGYYKNIVTGYHTVRVLYIFFIFRWRHTCWRLPGKANGVRKLWKEIWGIQLLAVLFKYLDPTSVSSDCSTVDLHYCYNDSFSCLVSFRSAFQSQQYKPSLNLTLWVDLKLPTWWRILWSKL